MLTITSITHNTKTNTITLTTQTKNEQVADKVYSLYAGMNMRIHELIVQGIPMQSIALDDQVLKYQEQVTTTIKDNNYPTS